MESHDKLYGGNREDHNTTLLFALRAFTVGNGQKEIAGAVSEIRSTRHDRLGCTESRL